MIPKWPCREGLWPRSGASGRAKHVVFFPGEGPGSLSSLRSSRHRKRNRCKGIGLLEEP
jgi:hypothetical protein